MKLINEVLKSLGECFIALLVSTSIVFSVAVIWKPDEFVGSTPLALAWSWQAIIIVVITSAIHSLSKLWIKHKSRLIIQLVSTVTTAVLFTIFYPESSNITPIPEILSLKTADPIEAESSTEMDVINNEVQELPDEL